MKRIQNFSEQVCLSTKEMQILNGGQKQLIRCTLRTDGVGSYYQLDYSDGSVEYVALDWYA
jgi:hypothetical protein